MCGQCSSRPACTIAVRYEVVVMSFVASVAHDQPAQSLSAMKSWSCPLWPV
ncbi:hypothetical protein DPMN_167433 [Dreissena polymorpha]|uniref:Uncharacterized protein n=1 Tax=Dreissena polymorpha TaxID=45954 RepID=A0A9D4IYT0_DREPO|nr:hypothetical protein DPMN_167433 [Dreissena polymorpha]